MTAEGCNKRLHLRRRVTWDDAPMRLVALVSVLMLNGCSWIFQDHLSSQYRGKSEPVCSDGHGWPIVDGVLAVLNFAAAASGPPASVADGTTYTVGAIVWGVVHTASAITGAKWASSCSNAKADYYERDDEDNEAELARFKKQHADVATPPTPAAANTATPRGFFCASSDAADFCERDRDACDRLRDVAAASSPDVTQCALVETAWCYGTQHPRCFVRRESCVAQHDSAVAAGSIVGDCNELR